MSRDSKLFAINRSLLHRKKEDFPTNLVLLASLFILESAVLLLTMAIYKKGEGPFLSFLASRPGFFFLLASLMVVASSAVIVHQYRKRRKYGSMQFGLTVMMNLLTVVVLLTMGELAVRLFSYRTPEGLFFMKTRLLPLSWGDVVTRNRQIWEKKSADNDSYLVYDGLLGWTVGTSRRRRSADGAYFNFSSVEGIRSPRSDMTFADLPTTNRIALIGDSFTFGVDVKYEESWGYQLERDLGPEFQVLNFGVPGYGLGQMYLRYYRDVRPWHPDVVIFGLINHDLYRTMGVYPFITFPQWGMPLAKPRFVVTAGGLSTLNVPLLAANEIFSKSSITDLPFIEYERGYNQTDWEWRFYHLSYLGRFLISRYPRWPVLGPKVSDEAMKPVNSELLRSFVRLAIAEGSIPIVVYFPTRGEASSHAGRYERYGKSILRGAGIEYTDLTPCVSKVSASERFGGKNHYSPHANTAVSKCLRDIVIMHFSGIKPHEEGR